MGQKLVDAGASPESKRAEEMRQDVCFILDSFGATQSYWFAAYVLFPELGAPLSLLPRVSGSDLVSRPCAVAHTGSKLAPTRVRPSQFDNMLKQAVRCSQVTLSSLISSRSSLQCQHSLMPSSCAGWRRARPL